MNLDHHRNDDEDDPPTDLRDDLLLMQQLSEVVHRVGAAKYNLMEMQNTARFLDGIPFDRSGLEKAALAMNLLNEAFESLNRERLRARDSLHEAVGFLDYVAAQRETTPGPGNGGGSQPAASGG